MCQVALNPEQGATVRGKKSAEPIVHERYADCVVYDGVSKKNVVTVEIKELDTDTSDAQHNEWHNAGISALDFIGSSLLPRLWGVWLKNTTPPATGNKLHWIMSMHRTLPSHSPRNDILLVIGY